MEIYEYLYGLCKARNLGSIYRNGLSPTPRVEFILKLTSELGLNPELDIFPIDNQTNGFNIILKGSSNRMITAHHDIVNPNTDNANDNSASIINAIAAKLINPEIWVVLLDGEEVGGLGSQRLSYMILKKEVGPIDWILNFELTGKGGESFFIGNYPGKLSDHIRGIFDCPIINTPFNDSVIFRQNGIDSVVINPLPILENGESPVKWKDYYLDYNLLYNCHTVKDSIDSVDLDDMQKFVELVVVPIIL